MNKKISKFVYWTPRILSIIFILFLALMSLDIFDGNYGFWGTIVGLLMHNIPVFILKGQNNRTLFCPFVYTKVINFRTN